ncbi:MAG: VTT domain-containing protein [Chloroflexota bacterium]
MSSDSREGPGLWARYRTQILALTSAVLITALIIVFREQVVALRRYGYLGVFLIAMLGNATVVVPVPGLAAVFAGGGVLNPLLVALVAGLGMPLGELSGYLAGYGGSAVVADRARYERLRGWMERRGLLTLIVLAAVPNPVFDLAGITAGMMRYPVTKFLLACWIGSTIKALAVAFLGSVSLSWVLGLLQGR